MRQWLALVALLAHPASAAPALESSVRASGWTSDRSGGDQAAEASAEVWLRARPRLADGLSLKLEGWAGINGDGQGGFGGDVRDAHVTARVGGVQLQAGRRVLLWGRADRFNPTDVAAARDYRRLVPSDDENRLGLAMVELSAPLAGGQLAATWLPEFRATQLPIILARGGLPLTRETPASTSGQFAVRFERFGRAVDWSVTYAEVADRTPWLALERGAGGLLLRQHHPNLSMLGADIATTLGRTGVRLEMAGYDYKAGATRGQAGLVPRFAATLGLDRDFHGQWSVIVQGVLRVADRQPLAPGASLALARRNDLIHQAWRPLVWGGTLRLRKGFADDRGSVELVAAAFGGGGQFVEAKASRRLNDRLRLVAMAQHASGVRDSFFGQLRPNNSASLALIAGF